MVHAEQLASQAHDLSFAAAKIALRINPDDPQ
jgi:hypothetical protein